ncbi:hypothetical protein QNM99_25340 [Pseudomonas sp. PCH446]
MPAVSSAVLVVGRRGCAEQGKSAGIGGLSLLIDKPTEITQGSDASQVAVQIQMHVEQTFKVLEQLDEIEGVGVVSGLGGILRPLQRQLLLDGMADLLMNLEPVHKQRLGESLLIV